MLLTDFSLFPCLVGTHSRVKRGRSWYHYCVDGGSTTKRCRSVEGRNQKVPSPDLQTIRRQHHTASRRCPTRLPRHHQSYHWRRCAFCWNRGTCPSPRIVVSHAGSRHQDHSQMCCNTPCPECRTPWCGYDFNGRFWLWWASWRGRRWKLGAFGKSRPSLERGRDSFCGQWWM